MILWICWCFDTSQWLSLHICFIFILTYFFSNTSTRLHVWIPRQCSNPKECLIPMRWMRLRALACPTGLRLTRNATCMVSSPGSRISKSSSQRTITRCIAPSRSSSISLATIMPSIIQTKEVTAQEALSKTSSRITPRPRQSPNPEEPTPIILSLSLSSLLQQLVAALLRWWGRLEAASMEIRPPSPPSLSSHKLLHTLLPSIYWRIGLTSTE